MKIDFSKEANLTRLLQTTAEIAMVVQEHRHQRGDAWWGTDSVALAIEIGDWAKEFEQAWEALGLEEDYSVDYYEAVDNFTRRRLRTFLNEEETE